MNLFCKIAGEYRPALEAALPIDGLAIGDTDAEGYVAILADDTADTETFWARYDLAQRTLNNAGILSRWERDLPALVAAIKARWAA